MGMKPRTLLFASSSLLEITVSSWRLPWSLIIEKLNLIFDFKSYSFYANYFLKQMIGHKCWKLNLAWVYLFLRSTREFIRASINMAVKNKLKDGINTGYQSFWSKL